MGINVEEGDQWPVVQTSRLGVDARTLFIFFTLNGDRRAKTMGVDSARPITGKDRMEFRHNQVIFMALEKR